MKKIASILFAVLLFGCVVSVAQITNPNARAPKTSKNTKHRIEQRSKTKQEHKKTKQSNQNKIEGPAEKPKEVKEEIFRSVEQMPQFPGGEAALMEYLQQHINYPPMAAANNVQGRVVVQFVVDKIGKVNEVKVVRSVDEELDKEAVRVCKLLPDFIPGRQHGTAVSVWYTLPISFILTK